MKDFPYFVMMRAVWRYLGEGKKKYVLSLSCLSMGMIISIFTPYIMGRLFDVIQSGLDSKEKLHTALLLTGMLFMQHPLGWLFHGPGIILQRRLAFVIRQNFVDATYGQLQKISYAWHQNFHSGQIFDRVRKAELSLEGFASSQFRYIALIFNFLGPVLALTLIFPWFGLICFIFCVSAAVVIIKFDKVLIPLYAISNKLTHDYAGVFSDYMANIRTIITLRLGKSTQDELLHRYQARKPLLFREYSLHETKWLIISHMSSLLSSCLIGAAILSVYYGDVSFKIGSLVMVIQYLTQFSRVFFDLSGLYQDMVKAAADYQSTLLIDQAYDDYLQNSHDNNPTRSDMVWQNIRIESLNFAYQDVQQRPHAIRDLSLTIASGEKIALIGASGSGKSTLMTLLRGLYRAESGSVKIDGLSHPMDALANITTLIPQDPELFENTIRYNITFGVEHSEEEIMHSCKIAGFDKVIAQLPTGLESDIREKGVNLSGGQKQRLALARGVFAIQQSSLVLLDEPTSSVDTLTEMRIFDRLFKEFPEKAMIASVHRLHLLPRFDRVIVMEDGRIVEEGLFEDLIESGGVLSKIWQEYQEEQKKH